MLLSRKIPKQGSVVRVYVSKNTTDRDPTVYLGSVQDQNKSSFSLGGLYENTTPLKGCPQSGIFVPLVQECISFPRPNTPLQTYRWEKVPLYPTKTGQHFVYVGQAPVPFTILSTADLAQRATAQTLMCLIGGTHSFYAVDFADVRNKLEAGGIRAFPEYTDSVYTDMLAILRGSMQRKVLKAVGGGLRDLQGPTGPASTEAPCEAHATELKLCV